MKQKIRHIFLLLALMLLVLPAQARKNVTYELVFKINGCKDSVMYLGYYFASTNFVHDTAYLDKKGRFVFTGIDDTLPEGLYYFANPQGHFAEFVIYHEKPFFTFETDQKDWVLNMKVKGSKQNEFFYNYHQTEWYFNDDLRTHNLTMDSVEFAKYRKQVLIRIDSLQKSCMYDHPEMFFSKMLLSLREVDVPVVDDNGDSLTYEQRSEYYYEHYFDNIPLEDDAIIRTPKVIFYDRTMNFYDSYLKYALPPSIIHYTDAMLARAKSAPTVFQYLVTKLTQKYLQSKMMVHDEVYVHMVKKYWASDDNTWSTPSSIEKELTRANKWEKLLVGHEAPELILFDTLHVPHSLHAFPHKWKLLIFWSPTCGHCKHVIPEVYRVFDKYRDEYDLGAFTILSEPDDKTRALWREFMREHNMTSPVWLSLDGGEANVDWHDVYDITSTPQIYLLDEHNVIQAKKLGETSIENVLNAICGGK